MAVALIILAVVLFLLILFLTSALKVAREYERGSSSASAGSSPSRRAPGSSC